MDSDQVVYKCQEHIRWATKAAAAQDYLNSLIDTFHKELFEEFLNLDAGDEGNVRQVIALKNQMEGLSHLKQTMESHINSGKLARAKLAEMGILNE